MENHPAREVQCPKCTSKIIRKSQDGMFRLSNKVVKISDDGGHIVAVCKSCGYEHALPCSLQWSAPPIEPRALFKSQHSPRGFRFQYQPDQNPNEPEVVVRPSAQRAEEEDSE